MPLGKKGIATSFAVVILVAVIVAAFLIDNRANISFNPPTAGQTPLAEAPQTETTAQTETEQAADEPGQLETTEIVDETTVVVETAATLGDHVVISEIKVAGDEFVELYNPTDSDIDLSGWWIGIYPAFSDWNEPNVFTPLKNGLVIKSHGFVLIGGRGYASIDDTALSLDTTKVVLSDVYGGVAILNGDVRGLTPENAKAKKVDAVGWVASEKIAEGSPIDAGVSAADPTKSWERKPGQSEPSGGNYIDTENNAADFVTRDVPEPQSFSSDVEP